MAILKCCRPHGMPTMVTQRSSPHTRWMKGIDAQFEKLDAEGDADDGDAHQQPYEPVDDGDQQAAEDEPDKISQEFHTLQI